MADGCGLNGGLYQSISLLYDSAFNGLFKLKIINSKGHKMCRKFFFFVMLLNTTKLLAINSYHERPIVEEPLLKKTKSEPSINPLDFKEALHLLCAQGQLQDIKAMLEITKINKINLVDGPSSKTAFEYLIDYYIDNTLSSFNEPGQNMALFSTDEFIEVIKEFILKQAFLEPTSLQCLDLAILHALESFTRNLIKNNRPSDEDMLPFVVTFTSLCEALEMHNESIEYIQRDIQFQEVINLGIKTLYESYLKNRFTEFKAKRNPWQPEKLILFHKSFGPLIKIFNSKIFPNLSEIKQKILNQFCHLDIMDEGFDEILKGWADLLYNEIMQEVTTDAYPITCCLITKKSFILQMLAPRLIEQNSNIFTRKLAAEKSDRSNEKTFLHRAVQVNADSLVRLAIDNEADVNAKNILQQTPLHVAVEFNNRIIKNACDRDKSPNAREINQAIIKLLLDNGANPNSLDGRQQSPFMQVQTLELAILFKEKGGEIDTKLAQPELIHTCGLANPELLEFWWKLGVDFQQKDKYNRNLLINFCFNLKKNFIKDKAETHKIPDLDEKTLKQIKVIEFLVSYGIDINAQDHQKKSALIYAIQKRYILLNHYSNIMPNPPMLLWKWHVDQMFTWGVLT